MMTVSVSAQKVTSGFSVSSTYLPARFPFWDYKAAEWISTNVNGFGVGVEYNLSVPLLQSDWEFRTGIGCTYSRIDDSGNKEVLEFSFYAPGQSTSTISGSLPDPFKINTYCETNREYYYAYIPVEIGYRFFSGERYSIIPFLGVQGKYNIGFTEKGYHESATWSDYYFDLFDESAVKSEAERFILGVKAGVEIDYDKLFLSFSYTRDMKRMYRDALLNSTYRGYWGPYTFNCWQLGIGMNF
jgi:hypothetical protein